MTGLNATFEVPGERILEMIVRQCEPREVLNCLCAHLAETEQECQVAFFTLDADRWVLAAQGRLTEQSSEALRLVMPEAVSRQLLLQNPSGSGGSELTDGWGCHIYSGIGEQLGLLLWLASGPFRPWGKAAARVEAVCRLAALCIEQRNLREELIWQGQHDSVTGLYTRTFFERMLAARLQQPGESASLLHINLDRFRLVNDVLGHALGNRILKIVGRRFSDRLDGEGLLARAGGDEFVVLLGGASREHSAQIADQLLLSLEDPVSVDEHHVFISASIGISCGGPDTLPQTLQSDAYVALYHAKQEGKSRCVRFDASMAVTPPERLEMEKCLRAALGRNEMLLYYQPQLDLVSGLVRGAEALLRWNPGGLGIIAPGAFIPILEETGLIIEFGRWVLREACLHGRRCLDARNLPLRIGVNVSALQLRDPGFVADVRAALADSGFPAEGLELELTESIFIGGYQQARQVIEELQAMGVLFALDDFGTGQSSLSYLQELPFQRLKIDQSFVQSIGSGERCPPVIANIVRMAKSLGMATIAEGLDRGHHAEVLSSIGCEEGQGYVLSYPLPGEEFLRFWVAQGEP